MSQTENVPKELTNITTVIKDEGKINYGATERKPLYDIIFQIKRVTTINDDTGEFSFSKPSYIKVFIHQLIHKNNNHKNMLDFFKVSY